jgi:hypothetical protein
MLNFVLIYPLWKKIFYKKMSILEVQKHQKNPSKQAKFKMKSEFWPKLMYPEFLYKSDTYLKNPQNRLLFKSKSKNMMNLTDFKIFKISLPIKIYPQIYKIRPKVEENVKFLPFFFVKICQ